MGIRLVIDKIAELVSAATPRSEASRPFILAEDSGAWTPDIIARPASGHTRMFTVRPSDLMPRDDGEAGTPAGRLTQIVEIKIIYLDNPVDRVRGWELAMEDCATIQAALQQPLQWDCPTTGINSIAPALDPFREELDQGDRTVGFVLVIPSPVTYREVSI